MHQFTFYSHCDCYVTDVQIDKNGYVNSRQIAKVIADFEFQYPQFRATGWKILIQSVRLTRLYVKFQDVPRQERLNGHTYRPPDPCEGLFFPYGL